MPSGELSANHFMPLHQKRYEKACEKARKREKGGAGQQAIANAKHHNLVTNREAERTAKKSSRKKVVQIDWQTSVELEDDSGSDEMGTDEEVVPEEPADLLSNDSDVSDEELPSHAVSDEIDEIFSGKSGGKNDAIDGPASVEKAAVAKVFKKLKVSRKNLDRRFGSSSRRVYLFQSSSTAIPSSAFGRCVLDVLQPSRFRRFRDAAEEQLEHAAPEQDGLAGNDSPSDSLEDLFSDKKADSLAKRKGLEGAAEIEKDVAANLLAQGVVSARVTGGDLKTLNALAVEEEQKVGKKYRITPRALRILHEAAEDYILKKCWKAEQLRNFYTGGEVFDPETGLELGKKQRGLFPPAEVLSRSHYHGEKSPWYVVAWALDDEGEKKKGKVLARTDCVQVDPHAHGHSLLPASAVESREYQPSDPGSREDDSGSKSANELVLYDDPLEQEEDAPEQEMVAHEAEEDNTLPLWLEGYEKELRERGVLKDKDSCADYSNLPIFPTDEASQYFKRYEIKFEVDPNRYAEEVRRNIVDDTDADEFRESLIVRLLIPEHIVPKGREDFWNQTLHAELRQIDQLAQEKDCFVLFSPRADTGGLKPVLLAADEVAHDETLKRTVAWPSRCFMHQGGITAEEVAEEFFRSCSLSKKKLEKKFYLTGLCVRTGQFKLTAALESICQKINKTEPLSSSRRLTKNCTRRRSRGP
eukprot:g1928.t1